MGWVQRENGDVERRNVQPVDTLMQYTISIVHALH